MASSPSPASAALWCGGYVPPHGSGAGIAALALDSAGLITGASLAAPAASPSFVAAHPSLDLVYAVAEFEQTLRAYRRAGALALALEAVGEPWPAGGAACHIAVDPDGRFLVVTCWGDGAVLLYELDEAGAIVSRHAAAAATDPHAGAAASARPSRAHASLILPDGSILTTDLGYDLVRVWSYRAGVGLLVEQNVVLPAGSGPRHLTRHPGGLVFVVTEVTIEVVIIGRDADGGFAILGRGPATAEGAREGDAAAEISVDESGERVHVTVRGSNRVATLAVHEGGLRLEPLADVDCGGDWPRHHLVQGGLLHVANQLSNAVTTFRLDAASGVPTENLGSIETGSPTCLLAAR